MKQLSKKLTLVVLMLLSAIFMFCGAASLGTMAVNADDSANSAPPTYTAGSETDDWYSLSYSRDHFTLLLDGNYRSYLDSGVADVKEFGGTLVSALREIIIGSILDVQKNSSGTSNVSRIVALADEGGYNPPEQLDKNFWENSQQLKDFRDYVLDRLSQPDEMQKYLDGEYDFLLEYAVGSYVESQGGTLSDAQKEKVETEIGEVLTEAKGHVDSYFDEQLKRDDLTTDEKAALTERKNQLNAQYAESVESTEQGGGSKLSQIVDKAVEAGGVPQITLKDIVTKFEGIYVDGKPLFTRTAVEGYEGGINLSALRYLATKIPRPSEIAQFTAEDFRTFFALKEVKIETTYGTIDFALTLGFKGETKAIRTAAEYLARYITVGVDGNAVSVQLLAPEAVTKALRKTVESTHFTDAQKNLVFSVFGKTADEIYDKATSYTVEDLLAFFKGVDYKYWFSNLTNAQFVLLRRLSHRRARPPAHADQYR